MATPRSRPTTTPNLTPPSEVQEIAGTLEQAGHETWCVGGAVRDALLGLAHLDWDLATAATPAQVKRAFKRTVPVGEAFGTIGVLDRRGRMHEVTTFRRDVQTDGRHAVVEFGASLDDDLARRDFTINAIAYSPLRRVLHDPYGGREDLAHGVVRAVGDPRARMVEDRLRALRALRFAGRLGFRIEPATWAAIVESAPYLPRLSRERVKQELEKTMEQVAVPSRSLRLWGSAGAMRSLIPALDAQPAWLWYAADHVAHPDATRSAGRKRRRTLLRLATMFLGLSRDVVARTLRDLRFSNRDVDWIAALAAQATALRPALRLALGSPEPPGDAVLRRWAADAGRTRFADTWRVAAAALAAEVAHGARDGDQDPWGDGGDLALRHAAPARARSLYRRGLRAAFRDPVEVADLAVDGDDLLREGSVARGPALGTTLRRLLDAVVDDPARNDRATLLAMARAWSAAGAAGGRGEG